MSKPVFDYELRVSPGARSVRLRVTHRHGLEVIVPKGYDPTRVPGLLRRKRNWVRAALERAEAQRKFFEPEPSWRLPAQIKLQALGKTWHLEAKETEAGTVAVREVGENRLMIFGAITVEEACRRALRRWLMRETRKNLVPRLQSISVKSGLHYKRTMVKRQRTRWASCSRHKTISLNAKLLFLPSRLVDYAIIHELCHIAEMNHSKRFWKLLARHCPDYRKLDTELREMWKVVPRWV